jgi:hypothetical protein
MKFFGFFCKLIDLILMGSLPKEKNRGGDFIVREETLLIFQKKELI